MRLYPAIDLKGGQCVRLSQGDYDVVTVFNEDPVAVAKLWKKKGASYLHLIDLDGAKEGRGVNDVVIKQIIEAVSIPVQLGGGIRTLKAIEDKLACGVSRVILGSIAIKEPSFVSAAIEKFGAEKIVLGIDAKEGQVAIEGWLEVTPIKATLLAKEMVERGIRTIIYTDIAKDGMMQGPNYEMTRTLVQETGVAIIASGGVAQFHDLECIETLGVEGVIIGKALYLDAIDLEKAVQRFERGKTC